MYPSENLLRYTTEPTQGQNMNSTTVLCIKGDNRVVMAADGQVTLGSIVMKAQARKVRKIYHDKVIVALREPLQTP